MSMQRRSMRLSEDRYAFFGTRFAAHPLKQKIEGLLAVPGEAQIDFGGVAVTQSFVDELVGALIVKYGAPVLDRLVFTGCTPDTRAIIEYVITVRLQEAEERSEVARA